MKLFFHWLKQSIAAKRFIYISTIIGIGYFVLQKINYRDGMSDFRVYYDAATAIINNTSLYGVAFGLSSGFYKYSPFAAFPFIPLSILPYTLSSAFYYSILFVSIIFFTLLLVYYLEGLNQIKNTLRGWSFLLVVLFLANHFERELLLGNVNVFLLIASFILFQLVQKEQPILSGFVFAFILLVKLHFVILVPYFLLKQQWRLLVSATLFLSVGLFMPVFWKGIEGNWIWLTQWIETMQGHNMVLLDNNTTLYGMYKNCIALPLDMVVRNSDVLYILSGTALLFLMFILKNKKLNQTPIVYIEYFLLVALIPNLTHTDTEHFLWTWPLITYVIILLLNDNVRFKIIYISLLVLAFVPYSLNSRDIIGIKAGLIFDRWGFLGIANLMIIAVSLLLFRKQEMDKFIQMKNSNQHPIS